MERVLRSTCDTQDDESREESDHRDKKPPEQNGVALRDHLGVRLTFIFSDCGPSDGMMVSAIPSVFVSRRLAGRIARLHRVFSFTRRPACCFPSCLGRRRRRSGARRGCHRARAWRGHGRPRACSTCRPRCAACNELTVRFGAATAGPGTCERRVQRLPRGRGEVGGRERGGGRLRSTGLRSSACVLLLLSDLSRPPLLSMLGM